MRRDWRAAVEHHDGRPCRVCLQWPRELAHIIPRRFDHLGRRGRGIVVVDPRAVVPLCQHHHGLYDRHQLDLRPHLTEEEWAFVVAQVGEGEALRRVRGA